MGDVLITSGMDVVKLPDLAYIAETHPLALMRNYKVPAAFISTGAEQPHSSKLYFNRSWAAGTTWRVYYSAFPSPAVMKVATASNPLDGSWTIQTPTVPDLEAWELASYGMGSIIPVKTPGMAGAPWKAFYQYKPNGTPGYRTGIMDTVDGLTFTNKRQVSFVGVMADYYCQAITGAIWDEVEQKFIAVAHVGATSERLYGAVVESTDGVTFTTRSLLFDPGMDRGTSDAGDLFDVHWIEKIGSVYVILWTTNRAGSWITIETGMAVSVDLDNWYSPPRLIWPNVEGNAPLRYPSSTYVNGAHYIVGVNSTTTGIDVCHIPRPE